MNTITTKFDLRAIDFHSGKRVSPPRSEWKTCNCCGRKMVKGFNMTSGDMVGEDCAEVIKRVQGNAFMGIDNSGLFKMFGTEKRVQDFALGTL